jgi:hypothetical protein
MWLKCSSHEAPRCSSPLGQAEEREGRSSLAHYYLYAQCKTEGCKAKLFVLHFEFADVPHVPIDYPEQALHLSLRCSECGQLHQYVPTDLRTESSVEPHHPEGWHPVLPFPPEKPRDSN